MKWLVMILTVIVMAVLIMPTESVSGGATVKPSAVAVKMNKTTSPSQSADLIANFSVLNSKVLATLPDVIAVKDVRVSGPINQSRSGTRIFFTVTSRLSSGDRCEVKVEILDSSHHVLRTIRSYALPGNHYFDWDGKDDDGVKVPSGTYEVRVTATFTFYRYEREWVGRGNGTGQFTRPCGIAVDDADRVYVVDTFNERIQKFDSNGNHLQTVDRGYIVQPVAVAINHSGYLYSTDTYNRIVNVNAPLGDNLTYFGWEELAEPRGIAFDQSGRILVADAGADAIKVFRANGTYIWQINRWTDNGQDQRFKDPFGVAVDDDGNIIVADSLNHRIVKLIFLDLGGGYYRYVLGWELGKTGSQTYVNGMWTPGHIPGSSNGQFYEPIGVAIDEDGCIFVADSRNNRIQKLTPGGNYIMQWGREGHDEGEFLGPIGVAVDDYGRVYVIERQISRVQKFTPYKEQDSNSTTIRVNRGTTTMKYARPSPRPALLETEGAIYFDLSTAQLAYGGLDPLGRQSVSLFSEGMRRAGDPGIRWVPMSGNFSMDDKAAVDASPTPRPSKSPGGHQLPVDKGPGSNSASSMTDSDSLFMQVQTPSPTGEAQASPSAPGPLASPDLEVSPAPTVVVTPSPEASPEVSPVPPASPTANVISVGSGISWMIALSALVVAGMAGTLIAARRKR